MATIALRFTTGAATLTGSLTVSDANAARILAAEGEYMSGATNQATVDLLIRRFLNDMIGDTKTIERNKIVVADLPAT